MLLVFGGFLFGFDLLWGLPIPGIQSHNTVLGYAAMAQHETGLRNIAIGSVAMAGTQAGGDQNTSSDSDDNVFIGYASGGGNWANAKSEFNTAIGNYTMDANAMNGAVNNTALGYAALSSITTGGGNTAIGFRSGDNMTNGTYNTFLGYSTGTEANNFSTGDECTLIGFQAGLNNTAANFFKYNLMSNYCKLELRFFALKILFMCLERVIVCIWISEKQT